MKSESVKKQRRYNSGFARCGLKVKTMEILYLRSTVKKINNQAIRVPHLAKPQNVVCNLRARKRERLMQFEINFVHNIKNNLNKRNIL